MCEIFLSLIIFKEFLAYYVLLYYTYIGICKCCFVFIKLLKVAQQDDDEINSFLNDKIKLCNEKKEEKIDTRITRRRKIL